MAMLCSSNDTEADESLVAVAGSSVLIDVNNGDRLSFARLQPSATIKIGRSRCSLAPLINSPYGSVFELQRGHLVRVPASSSSSALRTESESPSSSPLRDNRGLVDDNTAQQLSAEDIDCLRRDCTSGKDIVAALVANSKTFHSKTAYSQEKYLLKKQKKYAPRLVLRRPSARRICETYYLKSPQRIGFLRMDTLGLMLSLANVGAHAEVLVIDSLGGLLTAAAAERSGGFSSVCNVYYKENPPPMDIVGLLNLSNAAARRVFRVSLRELSAAFKSDSSTAEISVTIVSEGSLENVPLLKDGLAGADSMREDGNHAETGNILALSAATLEMDGAVVRDDEGLVSGANVEKPLKNAHVPVRPGRHASSADISHWAEHGFTSLLIGAPEAYPWALAEELLKLLRSSAPFAIYHPYLQPLAECMHQLQANKMAVALEIVEPWMREYQVLSSRTHPHMQMHANGGYVLSGIKITM